MASQDTLQGLGGGNQREHLDSDGVLYPDYLLYGTRASGPLHDWWIEQIKGLKPGVTEAYMHAAPAGDEMQAITGSWSDRAMEFDCLSAAMRCANFCHNWACEQVGWRALRDLQRRERQTVKS
jgi:hypothetical protein